MVVGYSGTPLAKKLGVTTTTRLLPVHAPDDYLDLLQPLPPGMRVDARPSRRTDIAHVFVTRHTDLQRQLSRLRAALRPDAVVWVSWPKRSARVSTDVTENTIRETALPLGYVDVKVCAVSEVWSAVKLVVRRELR